MRRAVRVCKANRGQMFSEETTEVRLRVGLWVAGPGGFDSGSDRSDEARVGQMMGEPMCVFSLKFRKKRYSGY